MLVNFIIIYNNNKKIRVIIIVTLNASKNSAAVILADTHIRRAFLNSGGHSFLDNETGLILKNNDIRKNYQLARNQSINQIDKSLLFRKEI